MVPVRVVLGTAYWLITYHSPYRCVQCSNFSCSLRMAILFTNMEMAFGRLLRITAICFQHLQQFVWWRAFQWENIFANILLCPLTKESHWIIFHQSKLQMCYRVWVLQWLLTYLIKGNSVCEGSSDLFFRSLRRPYCLYVIDRRRPYVQFYRMVHTAQENGFYIHVLFHFIQND